MTEPTKNCPSCHHSWGAHQGRKFANACYYKPWNGYQCPCKAMNPEVEAEAVRAGALWNLYMGRSANGDPA
jgi:hypothetical protein